MNNNASSHRNQMELEKPDNTEPGPHLELEYDFTSDSSLSEHNSNRKDSVSDKPAEKSPPRSSISSEVSHLTHGSSPRGEKAAESPPPAPEKEVESEVVVKRSVKEQSLALVKVENPVGGGGEGRLRIGGGGGGGGEGRRRLRQTTISSSQMESVVKKAALGFRVLGFVFCLVSFSVMVADRKMGWAIDSFELYKEFRYSLSVNVIGFVYSGAQAIDLIYHSATGKNVLQLSSRCYFDFAIDQVMTYLLISASSSAATRVDDWRSNWGKDKFPDMATASVAMSFLAFVALAFSSLISGYTLCTSRTTHF